MGALTRNSGSGIYPKECKVFKHFAELGLLKSRLIVFTLITEMPGPSFYIRAKSSEMFLERSVGGLYLSHVACLSIH